MAKDKKPETIEVTPELEELVKRLMVEETENDPQIEYLKEAADQAEECWVVWDIADYAIDSPEEVVQSLFKTKYEAAQAWAKFQIKRAGNG